MGFWTRCVQDKWFVPEKAKKKLQIQYISERLKDLDNACARLLPEVRKRAPSRKEAAFETVQEIVREQPTRAQVSAAPGCR